VEDALAYRKGALGGRIVLCGHTGTERWVFWMCFHILYSYVADHFQYLASIGLIALTANAGAAMYERTGQRGRGLGGLAIALVLVLLAVSTWKQAHIYQDLETLWRDTLAKNPSAWMAHNNLSDILIQQGKIEEGIWHMEQALRLKPDDAITHNNLGLGLAQAGRVEEAIGHYEQALRIQPDYAAAHGNLGLALARVGRMQEAMEHYEQALRIQPDLADAHCNLGIALAQAGRVEEAIGHYQQALRIKPDSVEAHYNLGNALTRVGRIPEAIEHLERALRLKPDYASAHYNLGVALVRLGRLQEAMGHWEQALRSKPNYVEVENNLAWLLATLATADGGDPVRAVTLAQRACELTNDRVAEYLDTLGVACAAAGRFNDAIAAAQKALELARSANQPQLVREIASHLEMYCRDHAYRESTNAPTSGNP